jgi:hypothetical protein
MKEWLTDRNGDLAVALSKKLKLPMYGSYDRNGKCHHVFVMDESLGVGIDGRGIVPKGAFAIGMKGQIFKPFTKTEIDRQKQQTVESDIKDANLYIRQINIVRSYKMLKAMM